jgi:diguanylate cyclase (GGDEF)-like protein
LPDTTGEAALAIADALRHRVRKLAIVHRESEFGAVTVSVGVAVMDGEGSATAAGLIASADAALYRSKEGGRDRATLSGGDQNRTAHRRRA